MDRGSCQALLRPGVSSPSVREGVQGQALQGANEETLDTSNGGGSLLSSPSRRSRRALQLRGLLFRPEGVGVEDSSRLVSPRRGGMEDGSPCGAVP